MSHLQVLVSSLPVSFLLVILLVFPPVFPTVFPPVFQVVLPSLTLRDTVVLGLSGVRHQAGSRGVLHMGLGSVCQVWATEWSHPRLLLHI